MISLPPQFQGWGTSHNKQARAIISSTPRCASTSAEGSRTKRFTLLEPCNTLSGSSNSAPLLNDKLAPAAAAIDTNSARSILAEAVVNQALHGKFKAWSAGSYPKGAVHPAVVKLLRSLG